MKDRLGLILLFLVIINALLYPYAILNEESLIYFLVKMLSFISLTGVAFYFGKKKDININFAFLIAIILALINLIIFKDNSLGLIRIIPCIIIWNMIYKYFDKFIYIPIFFIIALLSGFYLESWLISLFPFFLLGRYELKLKISEKTKKIVSAIVLVILVLATIFILKRFYVSFDILNLSIIESKKHLLFRAGYFGIALVFLYSFGNIFKIDKDGNKEILLISLIPVITNLFLVIVNQKFYSNCYILYAVLFAIFLIILTNNKYVQKLIEKVEKIDKTIILITSLVLLIIFLTIPHLKTNYNVDKMYPKMSEKEINEVNNSFKISFVGDLIMLENQVRSGYSSGKYNFDPMFEYAKKYLKSDLTIGTLEGPVANKPYSVGNFDDGVALYLNYPIEFVESIKNSNIDLVTLANNHMFDQGVDGYKETIENLKKLNMDYIDALNDNSKIIEKDNLKIGILTYTYGSNYYTEEDLINLKVKSLIVSPYSKNFNRIKENVKKDFENLKSKVDLIIVLPHMGTQFSHGTDTYQNTWNQIFAEYGADIILGNHAHAVEPIEYIGDTFVVNCPGNFANLYRDFDGDATSIVDVYIDKNTKKVITSAVIPMYTYASNDGFFKALPIYEIMTNKELYNSIGLYEMKRIKEVHSLITKVMINEELDITNIEERYFFYKDGYKRNKVKALDISSYMENEVYNELKNATSYCFIGDSVTEGTKNGGYGWYEPLIANFEGEVKAAAYGSHTVKMLLNNKEKEIKNCVSDLNIIAIGTNDIRYRDKSICAMDEKEYIENIDLLVKLIKKENKDAKIIFIAPWTSLVSDLVTPLNQSDKEVLFAKYSNSLKDYSIKNNYLYIDPNEYILNELKGIDSKYYLKDHIHPNKINGINLYSEAVINN